MKFKHNIEDINYRKRLVTEARNVSFDAACYIISSSRKTLKDYFKDDAVQICTSFCPKCAAPWIAGHNTCRLASYPRNVKLIKNMLKKEKLGRLSRKQKLSLSAYRKKCNILSMTCHLCHYVMLNHFQLRTEYKEDEIEVTPPIQEDEQTKMKKRKKKKQKAINAGLNLNFESDSSDSNLPRKQSDYSDNKTNNHLQSFNNNLIITPTNSSMSNLPTKHSSVVTGSNDDKQSQKSGMSVGNFTNVTNDNRKKPKNLKTVNSEQISNSRGKFKNNYDIVNKNITNKQTFLPAKNVIKGSGIKKLSVDPFRNTTANYHMMKSSSKCKLKKKQLNKLKNIISQSSLIADKKPSNDLATFLDTLI